ncbi:MAG: FHA domain-containing protein [Gemmataceae bacterium]
MKLGLHVLTAGKQEGKVLEIKLPQFLIGRDPQCQLRPASPLISKRHCAILQREGRAFVRDFGSTNGTFINDEPVQGERELKDGDFLKVGPIQFRVDLKASPTPVPPTRPAVSGQTPAPPTRALPAKPTAPAKDETPLPATSPLAATARKPAGEDDDIAAMLLSLDDGDASPSSGENASVPEGSTVFDLKVPPEIMAGGAKPDDKAGGAKPASSVGDTRSAAARILEKMTKRPRT